MTVGIKRILDALKKMGKRFVGVLSQRIGEIDAHRRTRLKELFTNAIGMLPGEAKKIDETVLDATNRLRFSFCTSCVTWAC